MISFFTALKPFRGATAIQQANALRSWRHTVPNCEIFIFGETAGAKNIMTEVGAFYNPEVECNERGTPLISAMFTTAQRIARHDVLCYINGDIILLSDFPFAIARLASWPSFAAVGRRWDLNCDDAIDFSSNEWEERLRAVVSAEACQHDPVAMDYFAFRKGAVGELPPFAIGRPGWDNYLIAYFCRGNVPIVDLSRVAAPIHQNHDYAHVQQRRGSFWDGPEGDRNLALAKSRYKGFNPHYHSIMNAHWVMGEHWVMPALSPPRVQWRLMSIIPDKYRGFWRKVVQRLRGRPPALARRTGPRKRNVEGT